MVGGGGDEGEVLAAGRLLPGTGFWVLPKVAGMGVLYAGVLAALREVNAGDLRVLTGAFRRKR